VSGEFNRRSHEQMQRELAEANEPRNRYQKRLDDWWQSQRDFEEELSDSYMVGGFMESWSTTPQFTKSKRDRDWRIK
jgi:hypothetical protein